MQFTGFFAALFASTAIIFCHGALGALALAHALSSHSTMSAPLSDRATSYEIEKRAIIGAPKLNGFHVNGHPQISQGDFLPKNSLGFDRHVEIPDKHTLKWSHAHDSARPLHIFDSERGWLLQHGAQPTDRAISPLDFQRGLRNQGMADTLMKVYHYDGPRAGHIVTHGPGSWLRVTRSQAHS
ncbi:hypothetical protein IE81DRAFT_327146 [Ceraceosorus guamensis]|uniref:Uncharacterized protein n=1 Tax=Ceraceosorus guamensis TaxID=1522189 RepID=A0A316VNZ4_9BASI|nr:hypothetical protein IE81DRAFT_327146 [Ceraceosorus guamensis]PWN38788.1 hypothetical protein IE81DRAFT_327146 [Ceraceosorus guamensis]